MQDKVMQRGVQRRGGGIAFGPVPRSHEIKLQKKLGSWDEACFVY